MSIIVIIATFFVLILQCSAKVSVNGNPPTMLILGDSISNGYGVQPDERYGDLTANYFCGEYKNLSRDGLTSKGLLNMTEQSNVKDSCKISDIIVFSIGGNDLIKAVLNIASEHSKNSFQSVSAVASYLSKMSHTELNILINSQFSKEQLAVAFHEFRSNLDDIINNIRSYAPQAEIIILSQYNPMSGDNSLNALDMATEPLFIELNNIINESAKMESVHVLDVYSFFKGNGSIYTKILSADIHPNVLGHQLISDKLIEYIETHFSSKPEWTVKETTLIDTKPETNNTTESINLDLSENISESEESRGCVGMVGTITLLYLSLTTIGLIIINKKKI